ncbi:hypothetical protein Syun_003438 [Stephania yunnanensis]|uniref:Thioredoxin domain-containing protein n=1 Tax=Stephania yunnanensis TaxID=152371 RepID=A0AAP0Q3W5_9MAGN
MDKVCILGLLLLLFFAAPTPMTTAQSDFCPLIPPSDVISGDLLEYPLCPSNGGAHFFGVTEALRPQTIVDVVEEVVAVASVVATGDEISFQKVINLVHERRHEYVAVLFYASWCPFSRNLRPTFTVLSSSFPSIRHFAVEESAIRPSILSKYGVHGFPTLFLLNSRMRAQYHGSRTVDSLLDFYGNVTGIKPLSFGQFSLEKLRKSSNIAKVKDTEQENCPFSWARSPENLLQQEKYLELASIFILLRLLYFLLPKVVEHAQYAWRRHLRKADFMSLWWHFLSCLDRTIDACKTLKDRCKLRNLHSRAKNVKSWVSKSLASVSIGGASSGPS